MMKKSLKILFLIILTIVPLTGCNNIFNYYEDKLYSEKTVLGEQAVSAKTSNVLTRESAIKKAVDVFDKGLNIKIDRTQFIENIKLVQNDTSGNLYWNITWTKNNEKTFYECFLNSSTGNIIRLQSFKGSNSIQTTVSSKPSNLEITNLLQPLLKQLESDINEYTINSVSNRDSNTYMNIMLLDKKNHTSRYIVTIDLVNKIVVSFENLDNQITIN